MRRLLILVIVLYVVWRVLGIVGRRRAMGDARDRVRGMGTREAPGHAAAGPRRLVACGHCGTLVPEDRAVRGTDGTPYCTVSCLEAGRKEPASPDGTLPPPSK